MAAFRDDIMHDKESLNNGNQYTTDDQVSVEAFNYNIENGLYAAKTAKEAKRIAEEAKESAYSYDDTEVRNLISKETAERKAADSKLQPTLVSGTNIKTINGESILGSGNIEITGDGSGGLTKADLLDFVYPVGSIYMSVNNVSPQTFLGGTWSQITTDAYLKIVTSNAGSAGGTSSAHKIPVSSMPSHNHTQDGHNHYMVSPTDAAGSGDYMAGRYNADRNSGYPTRSITSWVQPAIQNTGGSGAYYPYYIGVYVWKRTA